MPKKREYVAPKLTEFGTVALLTQGTGTTSNGDGGQMMRDVGGMTMSDLRAKENIVQVGWHPLGFGLYLFDYKPEFRAAFGAGRKLGVLAHEVEALVPRAVTTVADGYKRVDYGLLGIRLSS